jgi:4-hydroxy-3-methylbut-2-enyl diphosphate reductase
MDELSKSNVKVLSDLNTTRLELLKKIKSKDSVIVLSAHGSEQSVVEYTKKHFNIYYDLTCKHVLHNYQIIKQYRNKAQIIFYGKKNHPETKAIQSLDKTMKVIHNIKQIKHIDKKKDYVLINQTTIPQQFVKPLYEELKNKIKRITFIPTTCAATQKRHANILSLKANSNLIVVGDKKSNNTMLLMKLAQSRKIKTFLIENVKQIDSIKFGSISNAYLISGTSTSQKTVNQIHKRLQLI